VIEQGEVGVASAGATFGSNVSPAPAGAWQKAYVSKCSLAPRTCISSRIDHPHTHTMRWFSSLLSLGLLATVHAKSFTGSRLLIVLEDNAEQEKYGLFVGDLEGMLSIERVQEFWKRRRQVEESADRNGLFATLFRAFQSS
jgi:hypothetical protein